MNTAKQVDALVSGWKNEGLSKSKIVVNTANACIDWDYVYGALGQYCTPSLRRERAAGSTTPPGDAEAIKKKCQVMKGSKTSCAGCKFYPGGCLTRVFDCRGFTRWLLGLVGITLKGGGATSQWNTNDNWKEKGTIDKMPKDKVCCVFRYDNTSKLMEHTLLYDGEGNYIHCSGSVKKVPISKYKATHYAIPKGLDEKMPEPSKDQAVVYAENGKPVRMRGAPSIVSRILKEIPCGEIVNVQKRDSEWTAISYQNISGFMMSKFLKFYEDGKKYTCTIPGLTSLQADELIAKYPGATKTAE